MLTRKPTRNMIKEWKKIFESKRGSMSPNRRTGRGLDEYFRSRYACEPSENDGLKSAAEQNIFNNEHSRKKLKDRVPDIKCYETNGVTVCIDIVSGEFFTESRDISKSAAIYDDLFLYRDLDEEDLNNYYLVAEYVRLSGV